MHEAPPNSTSHCQGRVPAHPHNQAGANRLATLQPHVSPYCATSVLKQDEHKLGGWLSSENADGGFKHCHWQYCLRTVARSAPACKHGILYYTEWSHAVKTGSPSVLKRPVKTNPCYRKPSTMFGAGRRQASTVALTHIRRRAGVPIYCSEAENISARLLLAWISSYIHSSGLSRIAAPRRSSRALQSWIFSRG